MKNRTVVERAVGNLLKPLGFRKTHTTWRRSTEETVLVLNLQKSRWGPELYINLGIYLRRLGAETSPQEHRCHIRARLDSVLDNPNPLIEALNLESGIDDTERQRSITEAITRSGLPWLQARETEAKARSALSDEKKPTGLVFAEARRLLGLSAVADSERT